MCDNEGFLLAVKEVSSLTKEMIVSGIVCKVSMEKEKKVVEGIGVRMEITHKRRTPQSPVCRDKVRHYLL